MPNRLVRVFRHQFLELGLSLFVFEMSGAGAGKCSCKFGPGITRAAAMRGFGGSNAEERWRLATSDTAPEFTLSGDD